MCAAIEGRSKYERDNRRRCIAALALCVFIILTVFIGVVFRLTANISDEIPDAGLASFRYFTILSGMFLAVCAGLCLPYQVDGLRYGNYHLPLWVVRALFVGVVCSTFTLVSCLIFSVFSGNFASMFLHKANHFLHLLAPTASLILFLFVNHDHRVPSSYAGLPLIPIATYGVLYYVMVFRIGEDRGGWRDQYSLGGRVPLWLAPVVITIVGLGIAEVLRLIHNRMHARSKADFRDYYLHDPVFECADASEAARVLARYHRDTDKGGELIVPRRALTVLAERYGNSVSLSELCRTYCEEYLDKV